MKIKCPECEAIMVENEEAHICESCDHTIALDEANELFEDGKLTAVQDEDDVIEENVDEEVLEEEEVEEYHGFTNKETWAAAIVSENEYAIYKQIKVAHKKEKLDEKFIKTLIENVAKTEDDILFEGVEMEEIKWDEVNEHFKSSMKDADQIGVDVTAALFADVELNESQKDDLVSIFESAVDIRVNDIKGGLLEDHQQKVDEAVAIKEKELEESTAKYIDHVVEEWYTDNEIVIEDSLKVEYAEDFIDRLHDLFQEHYVHVPEDRYDIIESLNEKVKSYESYETYALQESAKLESTITEMQKEKSIATLTDGMVETEKEKLAEIAVGVEFKDDESFLTEITKLKEAFISKEKTTDRKEVSKKKNESTKPSIANDITAAMNL